MARYRQMVQLVRNGYIGQAPADRRVVRDVSQRRGAVRRQAVRIEPTEVARAARIWISTPGRAPRRWSRTPWTAPPAGAATIAPRRRWGSSPAARIHELGPGPVGQQERRHQPDPLRGHRQRAQGGHLPHAGAVGRDVRIRQRREAAVHGLPHRQGGGRAACCGAGTRATA